MSVALGKEFDMVKSSVKKDLANFIRENFDKNFCGIIYCLECKDTIDIVCSLNTKGINATYFRFCNTQTSRNLLWSTTRKLSGLDGNHPFLIRRWVNNSERYLNLLVISIKFWQRKA